MGAVSYQVFGMASDLGVGVVSDQAVDVVFDQIVSMVYVGGCGPWLGNHTEGVVQGTII